MSYLMMQVFITDDTEEIIRAEDHLISTDQLNKLLTERMEKDGSLKGHERIKCSLFIGELP